MPVLPLKEYFYLGVVLAVLAAVVWFGHYERTIEANKLHAAQAAADAKETAHVNQVTDHATATIQDLQVRFAATLATPPVNPVVVRLCQHPTVNVGTGPQTQGAGSAGNATGGPGAGVAGLSEEGPDIGPGTELILNRLKGKLDYLQGYVHACQTAGVCETN